MDLMAGLPEVAQALGRPAPRLGEEAAGKHQSGPWQPLLDRLNRFSDDAMADRNQPRPQHRDEPLE